MQEKKELSVLEKSLLENINKKFGKDNPMMRLSDSEYGKINGWVDTGIYSLNWLISGKFNGGYPVGRITELDGDPGTGKSLLCQMAIADPTIDLTVYFDTESALNEDFLNFLKVDSSKILYEPIDTIEQLQQICEEVLNTIIANKQGSKKILILIDSIAMASTEKEMDPDSGADMGYKAREIRKFFRKYSRKIEKYNIALIVTNHYTQKIGVMFGNPKTTTGGTGLPYAASVRVGLTIAETEMANKKLEALGASSVTLKAKTEKNRCFSPKRKATFVLDFTKGVNRYSGLFQILKDYGVVQKTGSRYVIQGAFNSESFYKKDFEKLLDDNKEEQLSIIEALLSERVANVDPIAQAEAEDEAIEESEEIENKEQMIESGSKKKKEKKSKKESQEEDSSGEE